MLRVLKKNGILVFSFLEFNEEHHWKIFLETVDHTKTHTVPHLNTFIEESTIRKWAEKLGYNVVEIISGTEEIFNGKALGQSVAILRK